MFFQQGATPSLPYSKQQIQAAALATVCNISSQIEQAKSETAELGERLHELKLSAEAARSMATLRSHWPPEHQDTMLQMDQLQDVAIVAEVERTQAAYDSQVVLIKQLQCNEKQVQQFLQHRVPANILDQVAPSQDQDEKL